MNNNLFKITTMKPKIFLGTIEYLVTGIISIVVGVLFFFYMGKTIFILIKENPFKALLILSPVILFILYNIYG